MKWWLAVVLTAACSSNSAPKPSTSSGSAPIPQDAAPKPVDVAPIRLGGDAIAQPGLSAMAWSTDVVATANSSHVTLWSPAGKQLAKLEARVKKLVFSPDGKWLAGGDDDLYVWDVANRKQLWSTSLGGDTLEDLAFSHDGLSIAVASDNQQCHHLGPPPSTGLWLFDVESGHPLREFSFTEGAHAVAFSPDGKTWAYYANQTTYLVETGRTTPFAKLAGPMGDFAFTPDGKTLIGTTQGYGEDTVARIDIATRKSRVLTPKLSIYGFALSPDGNGFAISTKGGIQIHDAADGKLGHTIPQDEDALATFAFRDAKTLIVADGPQPRAFDVVRREWNKSPSHTSGISSIACAGDAIVTASGDGTARVWDATGATRTVIDHRAPLVAARITTDGKTIVTGGTDGVLGWWEVTGKSKIMSPPIAGLKDFVLFRDGRVAVAASSEIQVRPADGGPPTDRIALPGKTIAHLALSPDDAWLWGSDEPNRYTAFQWSTSTKQPMELKYGGAAAAFTPDGRTIVSAGSSLAIRDVTSSTEREHVAANAVGSDAKDLAFSAEGAWLAIAGPKGGLVAYPSLAQKHALADTGEPPTAVAFCGDKLVAGYASGQALVWSLAALTR